MSGNSDSHPCPICGNTMDTYTDWKSIDTGSGQCIYCGLYYYTKVEQMNLGEVNELRKEYNKNMEGEKGFQPLKPLTKQDLKNIAKE